MLEKKMRQLVVAMLQPLAAFPVENFACDGTPDVCTIVGWIELKVGKWPLRAGSRVRVELRTAQGIWMRKWIRHGGVVWTLTVVDQSVLTGPGTEWFLHTAEWAHVNLGNVDEETLRSNSLAWWRGKPDQEQLINVLLKRTATTSPGRSG